jgi:hypothetical protein
VNRENALTFLLPNYLRYLNKFALNVFWRVTFFPHRSIAMPHLQETHFEFKEFPQNSLSFHERMHRRHFFLSRLKLTLEDNVQGTRQPSSCVCVGGGGLKHCRKTRRFGTSLYSCLQMIGCHYTITVFHPNRRHRC